MARTTNTENTKNVNTVKNTKNINTVENVAYFCVIGELTDVYEGDKKNYLSIKVESDNVNPKTKKPYYNIIKITVDKDIELYDNGTIVKIGGIISSYFDKAINRNTMILTAGYVTPVSNK